MPLERDAVAAELAQAQAAHTMTPMFPYDPAIVTALQSRPQSISDVLEILHTIGDLCTDADGLKWFNWLYLQVTEAVKSRIDSGGFANPAWLTQLDIKFAQFYFAALNAALTG